MLDIATTLALWGRCGVDLRSVVADRGGSGAVQGSMRHVPVIGPEAVRDRSVWCRRLASGHLAPLCVPRSGLSVRMRFRLTSKAFPGRYSRGSHDPPTPKSLDEGLQRRPRGLPQPSKVVEDAFREACQDLVQELQLYAKAFQMLSARVAKAFQEVG